MDTEYFEVEAKAEGDGISAEEMRRMTQALLEDRFQLKSHRVERESAVYHLVVAKGGLKIKPSEDQTPPDTPQSQTGQRGFAVDASGKQARGTFMLIPSPTGIVQSYSAAPISTAVGLLQAFADRPIIDHTGLQGLFDVRLEMSHNNSAQPGGATSPLSMMEEQWGLNLKPVRAVVEVLVIDSVSRPTEN